MDNSVYRSASCRYYKLISETGYKENTMVLNYLKKEYQKYQTIGERLIQIILSCYRGNISRLSATFLTIKNILPPFTAKDMRVNGTILMVALRILQNKAGI